MRPCKNWGPRGRRIDRSRMFAQWQQLYRHLATRALVYLLPSQQDLQDQPFVANLGIIPAHTREPVAIVSRFKAKGRAGEAKPGATFFRAMGFEAETCPATSRARRI